MDIKLVLPNSHIALSSTFCIREICSQFMNNFGINYFRFMRMYKNGSRICLSTNPEWTRVFFEKGFYNIAWFDNKSTDFYKSSRILWDHKAIKEDNEVGVMARQRFNMSHGYTVIISSDLYCEFYDFTTTNDNYSVNDLYIYHPELFTHFIFYFRDKAKKIIQMSESSKIIIPEICQKIKYEMEQNELKDKVNKFVKAMPIQRFFIGDIHLSKKEVEILILCSKGMTTHEISKITRNSSRTIEAHLNSARRKLNCSNTKELLQVCNEVGLISSF